MNKEKYLWNEKWFSQLLSSSFLFFIALCLVLPVSLADTSYVVFGSHTFVVKNLETLSSGGDVFIDFTADFMVQNAFVSLDNNPYQNINSFASYDSSVGVTSYLSVPFTGTLLHGVLSNGNHILKINITSADNQSTVLTHSFIVADSTAPQLTITPAIDGMLIKQIPSTLLFNVSSNEYSTVSFNVNNQGYSAPADLGSNKKKQFSISMQEGANSLLVKLQDLQGNTLSKSIGFTYDALTESDLFLSLVSDKTTYALGENAHVIINAPNGSTVNLLVVKPDGKTQAVQYVNENYPQQFSGLYINIVGDYAIIGEMSIGPYTKGNATTLSIGNSISIAFNLNDTYEKNQLINISANVSGGVGDLHYDWQLGDGSARSEKAFNHIYTEDSNYIITLTVTDVYGNSQTATKTIAVQKRNRVMVTVKDGRTGELLPDVSVKVADGKLMTNAQGQAEFWIFNGTYIATAIRPGYKTFAGDVKIADDMDYIINLGTEHQPVVSILTPANNSVVAEDHVEIWYLVEHDVPISRCVLFTGEDPLTMKAQTEDRNLGAEKKFSKSFTINNVTSPALFYKVQCVDSYQNFGDSPLAYLSFGNVASSPSAAAETPSSEVPSIPPKAPETNLSIQQKLYEVEQLISAFNTKSSDERKLAEALGIFLYLDDAKKLLKNYDRDVYNLRYQYKDAAEQEQERKKLQDAVDAIDANLVEDLHIIDSNEYVKYPTADDVNRVIDSYANSSQTKISKKDIDSMKEFHIDYQSLLTVKTVAHVVELTYKDGRKETITVVEKDLKVSDDVINIILLEYIPKSLVANIALMQFKTPFTVLNKDPLIKFDASTKKQIVYIINASLDLSHMDEIQTILFDENYKAQEKNLITGFHSSSFSAVRESLDLKKLLLVLFILVLCSVLVWHHIDDFKDLLPLDEDELPMEDFRERMMERVEGWNPLRKKTADHPHLTRIRSLVQDGKRYLSTNGIQEAGLIYEDIKGLYSQLDRELKENIHSEISGYYHDITLAKVQRLVHKIELYLEDNNHAKAQATYQELQQIYTSLPQRHKQHISELCHNAYRLILEKRL